MKQTVCKNISPYLMEGNGLVQPVQMPISSRKPMMYGAQFYDGGNFILSKTEAESILANESNLKPYVKRLVDARSMLYGREEKYCLYLNDVSDSILTNPLVSDRIKKREEFLQKNGTRKAMDFLVQLKDKPCFQMLNSGPNPDSVCLVLPITSTSKRNWIPVSFTSNAVVKDLLYVIQNADNTDFAIISSRMHMIWLKSIGGKMGNAPRYSSVLVYNTFPLPIFDDKSKSVLNSLSQNVLDARSSDMNLASQYNPDAMPDSLKRAHEELDSFFERMYYPDRFKTDADRLSCLFRMYEEKIHRNPVNIDKWC